jgi:hypothetical protein
VGGLNLHGETVGQLVFAADEVTVGIREPESMLVDKVDARRINESRG